MLTVAACMGVCAGSAGCGGSDSGPDSAAVVACLEDAGANVEVEEGGDNASITATFPGDDEPAQIDLFANGEVGLNIPNAHERSTTVHRCLPE